MFKVICITILCSIQLASAQLCKNPSDCISPYKCFSYDSTYSFCALDCPSGWKCSQLDAFCMSDLNRKLSGVWQNDLGSTMTFKADCTNSTHERGTLSGGYNTAVGNAVNVINSFTGTWSATEDGAMVSFIVNFVNLANPSSKQSATTFNGKWYAQQNKIITTWVLVTDYPYADEWTSYRINKNIFVKKTDL